MQLQYKWLVTQEGGCQRTYLHASSRTAVSYYSTWFPVCPKMSSKRRLETPNPVYVLRQHIASKLHLFRFAGQEIVQQVVVDVRLSYNKSTTNRSKWSLIVTTSAACSCCDSSSPMSWTRCTSSSSIRSRILSAFWKQRNATKAIEHCADRTARLKAGVQSELNELNWTELNWIELNWTGLNWTELKWNEMKVQLRCAEYTSERTGNSVHFSWADLNQSIDQSINFVRFLRSLR